MMYTEGISCFHLALSVQLIYKSHELLHRHVSSLLWRLLRSGCRRLRSLCNVCIRAPAVIGLSFTSNASLRQGQA